MKRFLVAVLATIVAVMALIVSPSMASADSSRVYFTGPSTQTVRIPGGGSMRMVASSCQVSVTTSGVGRTELTVDAYPQQQSRSKSVRWEGVNPSGVAAFPGGQTSTIHVVLKGQGGELLSYVYFGMMSCQVNVYTTTGSHLVSGREWHTWCEPYSITTRCRTELKVSGQYVFNNLTYLPSVRSAWVNNPIGGYGKVGYKGTWDSGRWRVECDTPATGSGACRSYYNGRVNNIVLFK